MKERFWAKTGRGELAADGSPKYHPVICHLADTAAVAMEIVRDYLSVLAVERLERGLGLSGESLVRFCGFLAGCHDLGKVSPAFQFQVSEVGKLLVGETVYDLWSKQECARKTTYHGVITAKTLPEFLRELGIERKLARRLAIIVGGHHGFFPALQEIRKALQDNVGQENWPSFRRAIYEQLRDFVGLTDSDLPNGCDNAAAMLLAGLTTVSDWIASNEDYFPYASDNCPFAEYALALPQKAKAALAAMGWQPRLPENPLSFEELFPWIVENRDLQTAAIALAETLKPPCLVLVEASMGEGKTEASLYLADALQHWSRAGGFYIGLPTQATSNQMWQRVQQFLLQRYPQETVNLTLSHSAATLNTKYLQSMCRLDQVYDAEGRVVASKWHTARKRSLLSSYGVGTLDQGLMGVVRSRHQFVRLFGLAGRTVILDEIHAYDVYTSALLMRFLEWLALLGSPAIALSATLPAATRQALLTAYARGCHDEVPELPQASYPRITSFSPAGTKVQSFPASEHLCRSLQLRWVTDENWPDALQQLLAEGGCAAVICSTIRRAQAVYQSLQCRFAETELGLFHSRFLYQDREAIETKCLKLFGKDDRYRPHRYVLVATQVVEQSLDLDFDVMVSDLAPIDLLLQRSGRMHRHHHRSQSRLPGLKKPVLWLVQPQIDRKDKAQFAAAGYIYDRHSLLRSWLALRHRAQIQLPEETDTLIEAVYDLNAPIPASLEPVHAEDWQQTLADYNQAMEGYQSQANDVRIPSGVKQIEPESLTERPTRKEGSIKDDDNAIAAVTRLGRESVTTIFLQETDAGLVLPRSRDPVDLKVQPELDGIRTLLNHSTRISTPELLKQLKSPPSAWTSALLRHCRTVTLDANDTAQVGEWCLSLDQHLGVTIERLPQH